MLYENSSITPANRSFGQAIDEIFEEFPELAEGLDPWLTGRAERHANPHPALQGVLEWRLMRLILAAELGLQTWTLAQLGVLACALGGVPPTHGMLSAGKPPVIYGDVYEHLNFDDALGTGISHHGAAGSEVLERLADLGPTAEHALTDAVSRWWMQELEHSVQGWAEVGIRVLEPGSDL